jgi:hypothetical protein
MEHSIRSMAFVGGAGSTTGPALTSGNQSDPFGAQVLTFTESSQ